MPHKKLYKTTSVRWGEYYDQFITKEATSVPRTAVYKTGVKTVWKLNTELEAKLRACDNKALIDFYDKFFPVDTNILARVMGVIVASLEVEGFESFFQGKSYEHLRTSAWIMLPRADPDYVETEVYKKGGYMWYGASLAAWSKYDVSTKQGREGAAEYRRRCRIFYDEFDWSSAGDSMWERNREAWYLYYIKDYSFAQVSNHFGMKSKATFYHALRRYREIMNTYMLRGHQMFTPDTEELVTAKDKLIRDMESLYFAYTSWSSHKEKQWWCCYACLDWSVEQISYDWLCSTDEVLKFINKMYRVMEAYKKAHVIPLSYAPRSLTIHETLPETPLMKKKRKENYELLNGITSKLQEGKF